MRIFPAIDLYSGKAVRLLRGSYEDMTVYSDNPVSIALDFQGAGARYMHLVDLEGAKFGGTPNIETIRAIRNATDLFIEVGGGIRDMSAVEAYINAGVNRVILGTAAVKNPEFLKECLSRYGDKIAVGVDIRDGFVAIRGWVEKTELDAFSFVHELEKMGVRTIISTDISRDGAMMGTNRELYAQLSTELGISIIASGGVSSIDDIRALSRLGLYGAIIGKAYYTGDISLKEAIRVANEDDN